jgi:hypothetical protein
MIPLPLYRVGGGICFMRSCTSQGCISGVHCHCIGYFSLSGLTVIHVSSTPGTVPAIAKLLCHQPPEYPQWERFNTPPFLHASLTVYHSMSSGNLRVYPRAQCYSIDKYNFIALHYDGSCSLVYTCDICMQERYLVHILTACAATRELCIQQPLVIVLIPSSSATFFVSYYEWCM